MSAFPYPADQCTRYLDPLARAILARHESGRTTVVGIQGGQGTGKTTLAAWLADRFTAEGLAAIAFSIDDFYVSLDERRRLAARYAGNPFYRLPRGMPGTHRVDELQAALSGLKDGTDVDLPVFDKSAHGGHGDIAERIVPVRGRQDIALFEGWCVGMPECTVGELAGICRRHGLGPAAAVFDPAHIEAVLANVRPYRRIWRLVDCLVALRPESPSLHERWRLEQERELVARRGMGMNDEQVREMVRHFLPFTYVCYAKAEADVRLTIDAEHRFSSLVERRRPGANVRRPGGSSTAAVGSAPGPRKRRGSHDGTR